jgi:hypothetical protein
MKIIGNIAGRAGCLLSLWLACALAQAQSFTLVATERNGTALGSTVVAARTYPLNVTSSDSTYAGTHTLVASAGAQLCAPVASDCSTVGTCQASMDVTFGAGGQANVCLKMPPDVGTYTINVSEGATVGALPELTTIPSYFQMSLPATPIVNRAELSCPASSFTYLSEPLAVHFFLQAMNDDAGGTPSYNGSVKLATAISDEAHWRGYNITGGRIGLRLVGGGYVPTLDPNSPDPQADTRIGIDISHSSVSWNSSGQGEFSVWVTPQRGLSPGGPYANVAIGIAPQDVDGVGLRFADFNVDADGDGVNERAAVGTTTLRHGRLKIANAYGSDVLPLPVDVQAQAWNGTAFVNLTEDNCTPLDGGYFTLAQVGSLPQPAAGTTSVVGSGRLDTGKGRIALTRLTSPISGKVITAIKTKADSGLTLPLTPPGLDTYLPGVGTGTFGVYRSGPVVYRRELHY